MLENEARPGAFGRECPTYDGIEGQTLVLPGAPPPSVREPSGRFELDHFAVCDSIPARLGFASERELMAERGSEVVLHQPRRQGTAIGQRAPHALGCVPIDAFESEITFHRLRSPRTARA